VDLIDVYRIFHPTTTKYTFFSAVQGTFSKVDHVLGHKASLSKYKKIEITPCILSYHNALKLELNNKNNSRKYINNWRLNNTLLNDQWVITEIIEEIKSFLEANENGNKTYQNLSDTAKVLLSGKFIAMSAYIKMTERSQVNELMLHLKLLERQEQAKPQISRRREILKIRVQINETETKKKNKQTKNRQNKKLVI
jgi:hypothetical protein